MIATLPPLFHSAFNHLWQSTLFAAIAALLALTLKTYRARVRYSLWLAASLKFLVPFSLLVMLGARFDWPRHVTWAVTAEQISQTFRSPQMLTRSAPPIPREPGHVLPEILFAIWAAGSLLVLLRWTVRWRRVRNAIASAMPLDLAVPVPVISSSQSFEPGVVGIFRPVLLLPAGIPNRLTPEQFQAILAHELSHVRRRDNLAAAIHMLIEAAFWFHPLVWWLGAKMIEERERACDEDVLASGNEPHVYAQGILNVCKFYIESPLACAAGITGSDLNKRISRIMAGASGTQLNFKAKLALTSAAIASFAIPIASGIGRSQSPDFPKPHLRFEVVSIRPGDPSFSGTSITLGPGGRYIAKNMSIKLLIQNAYGVHDFQVSDVPRWADTSKFNINAKGEEGRSAAYSEQPNAVQERLQSLLLDRFALKFHTGTQKLPIYALVKGSGGPKFQRTATRADRESMTMGNGRLSGKSMTMDAFAENLSNVLGRVVQNRTGLSGRYSLDLRWAPDVDQLTDSNLPSIFSAIKEQLGLKLEPKKGPVPILIVDRVQRPSEN